MITDSNYVKNIVREDLGKFISCEEQVDGFVLDEFYGDIVYCVWTNKFKERFLVIWSSYEQRKYINIHCIGLIDVDKKNYL